MNIDGLKIDQIQYCHYGLPYLFLHSFIFPMHIAYKHTTIIDDNLDMHIKEKYKLKE